MQSNESINFRDLEKKPDIEVFYAGEWRDCQVVLAIFNEGSDNFFKKENVQKDTFWENPDKLFYYVYIQENTMLIERNQSHIRWKYGSYYRPLEEPISRDKIYHEYMSDNHFYKCVSSVLKRMLDYANKSQPLLYKEYKHPIEVWKDILEINLDKARRKHPKDTELQLIIRTILQHALNVYVQGQDNRKDSTKKTLPTKKIKYYDLSYLNNILNTS